MVKVSRAAFVLVDEFGLSPPLNATPFSVEYMSVVQSLDRAVGAVLDAADDSTIVLFTSDNGPEEGSVSRGPSEAGNVPSSRVASSYP